MTYSEKLRSLSAHCGVATSYTDYRGSHVDVADETLEDTLHALGLSFSHDDAGIDAASQYFYTKEATRSLPPTIIGVEGEDVTFPVHVIDGEPVDVWVVTEDGQRYDCHQIEDLTPARHVDYPVDHAGEPLTDSESESGAAAHAPGAASYGQASFTLPKDLPLGWHTIYASSPTRGQAETTLVIMPARLSAADDLVAHPQAGLMAQLYSVRDSGAWGIGDFYTLGTLARHAAEQGS
ncbi:MAG TPA: 4-alpha-glucanotransferase, partial [Corynebacterium kroppenstedtii]|nr:4-alpha-glucanotransferase [Corynebacterium kroppenstedtii]